MFRTKNDCAILTIFVISYIAVFLVCFLKAALDNERETKTELVHCGTVRTSTGTTVTLREGASLTPNEFELVHSNKLKNAKFSPTSDCAIKVCGYTWTEKTFYDPNVGFLTRNYADCQIMHHGNESEASSNIYNDLFNVTSLSCACKKRVPDCDMKCSNRLKSNWKDEECAILYEEKNCGECWFTPVVLHQGENYPTDNSHFIRKLIVRDQCTVRQIFADKGNHRPTILFHTQPISATVKTTFKRGISTFNCTCNHPLLSSNIVATTTKRMNTDTATSKLTSQSLPTTPVVVDTGTSTILPVHITGSCAAIMPMDSPTIQLFESIPIDRNEFENVRVGKLKNAVLTVGTNRSDQENCILDICGYSSTAEYSYHYGTCESFTEPNSTAPAEIFKEDFEVSSLSCACSTGGLSTCGTVTCLSINATKIWTEQECAIMFQETNCRTCYFKHVSLQHKESFQTLNSYQIKSIIVRPGCLLEKMLKIGGVGAPWTDWIDYIEGFSPREAPYYHKDSNNYSCYCSEQVVGPPLETSTVPTTTSISTTVTPVGNNSCGYIKPQSLPAIYLFENSAIGRNEYENIRVGQLTNALFAPATIWEDTFKCVLEVCGFSSTGADQYKEGACEWYSGRPIKAPDNIYTVEYEVSSLSCACRSNDSSSCSVDTCLSKNTTQAWNGRVCAIMHQERDCQSCYFKPVSLLYGNEFLSLNSYQFKSMIIRPGCRVDKRTKGYLWMDNPFTIKLVDVVNYTGPSFHKDSENFTCQCSPEVISEMLASETTTPGIESPESTIAPFNVDKTQIALSTTQYVIFGVGLAVIAVVGAILVLRFKNKKTTIQSENTTVINSPFETTTSGHCEEMFDFVSGKGDSIDSCTQQTEVTYAQTDKMQSCLSAEPESQANGLLSLVTVPESIICDEVRPNESQLKTEIMDEVKKYMESFFGSMRQDEIMLMKAERPSTSRGTMNDSTKKSCQDQEYSLVLENFSQICHPNHVLSRNTFLISNYDLENPLGTGHFGIVYKGVLRPEPGGDGLDEENLTVAVKKTTLMGSSEFLREIKIYESIGTGNDNIVGFVGACCHTSGLYILTEFCEGGSLQRYLIHQIRPKVQNTSEATVDIGGNYFVNVVANVPSGGDQSLNQNEQLELLNFCKDIACGMECLSSKGIIHVDLACRNILLTASGIVKICDFGLSRKCLNMEDCAQSLLTGDFPFNSFAPECNTEYIDEPRQVSLHVDIWAYGCTVWEIFTLGSSLYPYVLEQGLSKFLKIRKLLLEGYRHPKPPLAPDFVYEKMRDCWNEVPQNRPNFGELCIFLENKVREHLEA